VLVPLDLLGSGHLLSRGVRAHLALVVYQRLVKVVEIF
jgi:hypothetical protein